MSPLKRYELLVSRRNWKVEHGIPLYLWKLGHELKGNKIKAWK